jgi:hypothetical protein
MRGCPVADRLVVGDTVTLSNTFSVGGTPTSPTATTLVVTKPDGSLLSYSTADSTLTVTTGVVSKDVIADQAGTWSYKWTGTGAAADIEDGSFEIAAVHSNRLYVSLADVKSALKLTSTTDDYELETAINGACRWLDGELHRTFFRTTTATARTFKVRECGWIEVDDFWTTTDLAIATDTDDDGTFATAWAASDYELEPTDGVVDGETGWPYSMIYPTGSYRFPLGGVRRRRVRVTAKWGWAAVPPGVRQAALIKSIRLFKRTETWSGVAGFGEYGVVRLRDDPEMMQLVGRYDKGPVIA